MTAPKPISPAELDRILALRAAGWTINDIARRLRRMNSAITDALKAAGRPTPHGGGRRGVSRDPALAMKRCTKCGMELPALTEFYAHRTGADGRAAHCRECQKDRQLDRYRRQRDAKGCGEVPKRCSKCRAFKSRDAFTKDSKTADGLNFWCRECTIAGGRDRRARVATSAEPRERTYLPHHWHHIGDPALRSEVEAQYLSLLAPPPLFFSDGRRMDF